MSIVHGRIHFKNGKKAMLLNNGLSKPIKNLKTIEFIELVITDLFNVNDLDRF